MGAKFATRVLLLFLLQLTLTTACGGSDGSSSTAGTSLFASLRLSRGSVDDLTELYKNQITICLRREGFDRYRFRTGKNYVGGPPSEESSEEYRNAHGYGVVDAALDPMNETRPVNSDGPGSQSQSFDNSDAPGSADIKRCAESANADFKGLYETYGQIGNRYAQARANLLRSAEGRRVIALWREGMTKAGFSVNVFDDSPMIVSGKVREARATAASDVELRRMLAKLRVEELAMARADGAVRASLKAQFSSLYDPFRVDVVKDLAPLIRRYDDLTDELTSKQATTVKRSPS